MARASSHPGVRKPVSLYRPAQSNLTSNFSNTRYNCVLCAPPSAVRAFSKPWFDLSTKVNKECNRADVGWNTHLYPFRTNSTSRINPKSHRGLGGTLCSRYFTSICTHADRAAYHTLQFTVAETPWLTRSHGQESRFVAGHILSNIGTDRSKHLHTVSHSKCTELETVFKGNVECHVHRNSCALVPPQRINDCRHI